MIYLADTNVLLGFSYRADPRYRIVRSAVRELLTNGHQLRATSQNFAEFWNVSTRPADRNGFGQKPFETDKILQRIERFFPLLSDSPTVYRVWRRLVVDYDVSGVQVHDARLVATMLVHDVKYILTFNIQDFIRYRPEGIIAVDPSEEID